MITLLQSNVPEENTFDGVGGKFVKAKGKVVDKTSRHKNMWRKGI